VQVGLADEDQPAAQPRLRGKKASRGVGRQVRSAPPYQLQPPEGVFTVRG
jgi:hypothetical protein